VLFWLVTIGRYVLAAFVALVLSIVISILATLPFTHPGYDLGIGLLWALIFGATANLLLPLCLGITAELIQSKVLSRRHSWSRALLRSLMALPIAVGPFYAATSVAGFVESRRPSHWVEKEILAYAVSVASAYVALRIRKQPPQPAQ
jgi:uncharacterized membrane protein